MTNEIKAYKGGRTRRKLKKKARDRERIERRKTEKVIDALDGKQDGKQGFKVTKDYWDIDLSQYPIKKI